MCHGVHALGCRHRPGATHSGHLLNLDVSAVTGLIIRVQEEAICHVQRDIQSLLLVLLPSRLPASLECGFVLFCAKCGDKFVEAALGALAVAAHLNAQFAQVGARRLAGQVEVGGLAAGQKLAIQTNLAKGRQGVHRLCRNHRRWRHRQYALVKDSRSSLRELGVITSFRQGHSLSTEKFCWRREGLFLVGRDGIVIGRCRSFEFALGKCSPSAGSVVVAQTRARRTLAGRFLAPKRADTVCCGCAGLKFHRLPRRSLHNRSLITGALRRVAGPERRQEKQSKATLHSERSHALMVAHTEP